MYDDDEEIKRKRRNLILVIIIIVAIILLLLLLLFFRKPRSVVDTGMTCELEVQNGEKDEKGNYTGNVVVGFKSAEPEKDIVKKNIGIAESDQNGETYIVNKDGTTTVYGYVYNSKNEVATCSLPVEIVNPSGGCELKVTSGTLGQENWYTSEVTVKLNPTNTGTLSISKYNVSEKGDTKNTSNRDVIKVTKDGTTEIVGTIQYSNGKTVTCSLAVRKDATKPTCSLKATGTKNSKGVYTSNVTVSIKGTSDAHSGVLGSGFGSATDYSEQSQTVTANGKTTVYGYVVDKAGNTNKCSLVINKQTGSSSGSGSGSGSGSSSGGKKPTGATVVVSNNKMCSLRVTGVKKGDVYTENVVVSFKEVNDGLAASTISALGMSGSDQVLITGITARKEVTATGKVTYSNGKTATCSIKFVMDPTQDVVKYFLRNGRVGDKTNYTAGNWPSSAGISSRDGAFGGYTTGHSKDASVKCASNDSVSKSGWVVYMINGSTIQLIHAGVPICFTHEDKPYANALSAINNNSNAATFLNQYAAKSKYATWRDYGYIRGISSLLNVGQSYYLGGANNDSDYSASYLRQYYPNKLWSHEKSSGTISPVSGTRGLRPIVTLNSGVGAKNVNGVWQLAFATKDITDEISTVYTDTYDSALESLVDMESLY